MDDSTKKFNTDQRILFSLPPSEEWSRQMWNDLEYWVKLMYEQRLSLTLLILAEA